MTKPKPLSLTHWQLANYIEAHAQGKQAAIPLPDVAAALKIDKRKVQDLRAELLEVAGVVICSSTGKPNGLYWPTSVAEVQPFHAQLMNREDGCRRPRLALERKYPALKPTRLRTPPLAIRPSGEAVTAQQQLFEQVG